MHLAASITFLRDIGRYSECLVEMTIPVSGVVTIDGEEADSPYAVVLDLDLGLLTVREIAAAEDALVAAWERANLPYVLPRRAA